MKYILIIVATLFIATSAMAQQENEILQVDITKLSSEELRIYQKLKQKEASDFNLSNIDADTIGKYADIGKAFGTAFKECWDTVSDDAEKFAQSDAGKLTMILIAWKIMGEDALNLIDKSIQYFIGIPLLFVGTTFFIYIYRRNCIPTPKLVSKTKVAFFTVKKEYNGMTSPRHNDESQILYGFAYLIFAAACCLCIFVG